MSEGRDSWPAVLREVAEALGDQAALDLAAAIGGQRRHIPTKPGRSVLHDEINPATADFIIENYGGIHLSIPTFAVHRAEQTRETILANPHLSANRLATMLRLTSRRVEQIRAHAREDDDQPTFF